MTDTLYHIFLRISALTLAIALLFVSGVLSPITKELSKSTGTYVATAIGMNAAVLPSEVNTLSAQLVERERELTQREIAVQMQENAPANTDVATYVMSLLLFVLLVLILLNYVLDFMRAKASYPSSKTS